MPPRLARWDIAEPLEAAIPEETLARLDARFAAYLAPSPPAWVAIQVDRLTEMLVGFNVPTPDPEALAGIYCKALAALPMDALEKAIDRTIADWGNGHRAPFVAEILGQVGEIMDRRRSDANKVRKAKASLAPDGWGAAADAAHREQAERERREMNERLRAAQADPDPAWQARLAKLDAFNAQLGRARAPSSAPAEERKEQDG